MRKRNFPRRSHGHRRSVYEDVRRFDGCVRDVVNNANKKLRENAEGTAESKLFSSRFDNTVRQKSVSEYVRVRVCVYIQV